MSSRQEEKARRKAEREAAEAAAARQSTNKGRIQLALGGVVAIAVIAVFVLVIAGSGGGDDANTGGAEAKSAPVKGLPVQKITNLPEAARAADCTLKTYPAEGREHSTDPTKWIYKTNPPTSGTHNPTWAEDGIYAADNTPEIGFTVHTLEHGRIDIQYKPGTTKKVVDELEAVGSEKLQFGTEAYHVLVFQNNTDMPAAVAATAWTQSLTCPSMNDKVFDAIRAFRTEYTDKGPELIP